MVNLLHRFIKNFNFQIAGAIACIGFSWIASPACTELEMVTMDWLAEALNLPEVFMFKSGGHGGGVIQVNIYF